MIRVLHVINGMGTGGAEKDIMNWYRHLEKDDYKFDFLIRTNETFYKDEIERMDGKVYITPRFPRNFLANIISTRRFLQENAGYYDIIHVHGNALIYLYPLIYVSLHNYSGKRFFHCHSTKANGTVSRLIHSINRLFIGRITTGLIACSKDAGYFAYGSRNFTVINNGIDLKAYKQSNCHYIRDELGLSKQTKLYGHVGRFLPAKNHEFLIRIFYEIIQIETDCALILIGGGPLRSEIEKQVCELKISDKVFFLGERNDVEKIISEIDMIIFPSIYEGVPLVVLESQAAGTKCIYSNSISSEVEITPYVKREDITKTAKQWALDSISFSETKVSCNIKRCFDEKEYSIESTVSSLRKVYEG